MCQTALIHIYPWNMKLKLLCTSLTALWEVCFSVGGRILISTELKKYIVNQVSLDIFK